MLTRREREVVTLAVQGFTAREIGSQLYIGERTVETHLANAYAKLNVRSKLDLVRVVNAMGHADFRTGTEAAQQVTA
jgi:DNA-binding NarL/FixJ family response regulator